MRKYVAQRLPQSGLNSKEEYCLKAPDTFGCTDGFEACCKANTPDCMACAFNMTEGEYCRKFPKTPGCCEKFPEAPGCRAPCCTALIPECMACKANKTVEDFCTRLSKPGSCSASATACCQSMHVSCMACMANVTAPQYCEKLPRAPGCGDEPDKAPICCSAMIPECFACQGLVTTQTYCSLMPQTLGCVDVPPSETPSPTRKEEQSALCCKALSSQCLACAANMTESEYCYQYPYTIGCKKMWPVARQ